MSADSTARVEHRPLERLVAFLTLAVESSLTARRFYIHLTAILLFGAALRMFWFARFGWELPELQWSGTPLLTSGDGYWFASGTSLALGESHGAPHLPEVASHALVALTSVLASALPVSIDSIAAYLPIVLGPLIGWPIALIGWNLSRPRLGLIAGLLAVSSQAFLSRSGAGYFDTDLFALLVPLLVVQNMSKALHFSDGTRSLLWGSLWLGLYPFFYDRGAIIGATIAGVALIYMVGARHPRRLIIAASITAALIPVNWPLRVLGVAVVHVLAPKMDYFMPGALRDPRWRPYVIGVAALTLIAVFVLMRLWDVIPAKISAALGEASQSATAVGDSGGVRSPTYGDTGAFVLESRPMGLVELGERVSGDISLFVLGVFSFAALCLRARPLVLAMPLAGLGFFAVFAGPRFAVYLVPITAIGLAYGVMFVDAVIHRFGKPHMATAIRVTLVVALASPGVLAAWRSFIPTAIIAPEVAALAVLRAQSTPRDATVTWWDYGYPVVYFSRTRVFADGGRHGEDAGLVAEILMNPSQRVSANLARAAAEVQEELRETDWALAPTIFLRARERGLDLEGYLASLTSATSDQPKWASHTFMFLPTRLLTLLPTIERLRPVTPGRERERPDYQLWQRVAVDGTVLRISASLVMDPAQVALIEAGSMRRLKAMISVAGSGQTLEVRSRAGSPTATTTGLYLHDHALFIELDDAMLASTAIQLLVFERADPNVYELVHSSAAAKVWRSKL